MRASEILIEALKGFEGCRLRAYKCPAGVWTIGYGHTKGVKEGQVITSAQAESLLRGDLRVYESGVEQLGVPLTQCQFDALVDFAYNLGLDALRRSTLLTKIRLGASEAEIRKEFMRWVNAGGKRLPGLVRRREWEANRFFAQ
jgi:lysozyme